MALPLVCNYIKNDTIEPLDAPASLIVEATGITPQEQSGSGTPNIAALNIEEKSLEPMCLKMKLLSINTDISPDTNIPKRRKGAISKQRARTSFMKIIKYFVKNSIV